MSSYRESKIIGVLVLGMVYIVAAGVAVAVVRFSPFDSELPTALLADAVATAAVFVFSRLLDNSSVYDPYWSVAPILLAVYLLPFEGGFLQPRLLIALALVCLWGTRLTFNFLRHWRGLSQEDWRYADYRRAAGRLYWPLSFFGFHLFPTLVVFAGCAPLLFVAPSSVPLGPLDITAFAVMIAAIVIEGAADAQMRAHTRNAEPGSPTFRGGLWAYSRAPQLLRRGLVLVGCIPRGYGGRCPRVDPGWTGRGDPPLPPGEPSPDRETNAKTPPRLRPGRERSLPPDTLVHQAEVRSEGGIGSILN